MLTPSPVPHTTLKLLPQPLCKRTQAGNSQPDEAQGRTLTRASRWPEARYAKLRCFIPPAPELLKRPTAAPCVSTCTLLVHPCPSLPFVAHCCSSPPRWNAFVQLDHHQQVCDGVGAMARASRYGVVRGGYRNSSTPCSVSSQVCVAYSAVEATASAGFFRQFLPHYRHRLGQNT